MIGVLNTIELFRSRLLRPTGYGQATTIVRFAGGCDEFFRCLTHNRCRIGGRDIAEIIQRRIF